MATLTEFRPPLATSLVSLRRRPRSAALMRLAYRVAYRLLQLWTFVRRPEVRGTMVAVLDSGRVLLVRHTYGDRRRWELPGGWMHPGEAPDVAARREVAEELGIDVDLDLDVGSGRVDGDWDFKREHLSWFACQWPGGRGTYDPVEIAEVAWFALDALPPHLGGGAREVLSQLGAS